MTYTLTAIPAEGYEFVGWEGTVVSSESTISYFIPDTCNPTIRFQANFAEKQEVAKPPVADAGDDQEVVSGALVTLDSSGSTDSNGAIGRYKWEQTGGPAVVLSDNTAPNPTFTAPQVAAGQNVTLTFLLRVYDADKWEYEDTDSVQIFVSSSNEAPTANAGADQSVLTGTTVTLNGTGSSDPEGGALTYAWTQLSGTEVTLSDPTASSPAFTAPDEAGTLVFQLTVTDGYQASDTDTVTITVSVPSASASYRLFYPHVVSQLSAGGDKVWETDIIIVYTGTEESFTGTLVAYDASGTEVGTAVPVTLAPLGRIVYLVGATFESPETIRYIVLESEQDGAVGYELIGVDGLARTTFEAYQVSGDAEYQPPIAQSRASSAVPSSSGVFMTLDQAGWTGIVFVNPGDAEVTIELKAYKDDGEEIATDSFDLAAGGYRSGFASGFFLVKGALEGATHITYSAGGDVIAVQFSGDYSGAMLDSLPGA